MCCSVLLSSSNFSLFCSPLFYNERKQHFLQRERERDRERETDEDEDDDDVMTKKTKKKKRENV